MLEQIFGCFTQLFGVIYEFWNDNLYKNANANYSFIVNTNLNNPISLDYFYINIKRIS